MGRPKSGLSPRVSRRRDPSEKEPLSFYYSLPSRDQKRFRHRRVCVWGKIQEAPPGPGKEGGGVSVEQRIRSLLFYLSVAIFLIGLPFILSFSLNYKFDRRTLKFVKAGIIDLKTQPAGATVYLNGRLLNASTPATINELLPGPYTVRLELEGHYPWFSEVRVFAGKVARLDKIILFPLRPDIKQINQDAISFFMLEKEKVYYINEENRAIYSSDLEGEHFSWIGSLPDMNPQPHRWKVSPDKEKILFFNPRQIVVVYCEPRKESLDELPTAILDFPQVRILDVFWHSDSYHLILLTDKTIDAVEIKPDAQTVTLAHLNKRNTSAFYAEDSDALYFIDSEKAPDGKSYDNVYKLDLSMRFSPFEDLIKPKANE
jgi:hypothetical protein